MDYSPNLRPELNQIQKLVAHGYDFHCARVFILTVKHANAARQFLLDLASSGWVTNASQSRSDVAAGLALGKPPLSLGLTYKGLEALELNQRYRTVFMHKAKAFYQGALLRSAESLGDTGSSGSQQWESAYGLNAAHVILCLHADTTASLDKAQATLQAMAGAAFAQGNDWQGTKQDATHLDPSEAGRLARRVHFDLRDAISNPQFPALRSAGANGVGQQPHQAGELILGFENDYGGNAWLLPFEKPAEVSGRILGEPPEQVGLARFFKHGSFGVIRKMGQNEAAFQEFVAAWVARNSNADEQKAKAEWLRAKLLGRWDDGSVVRPGQEASPHDTCQNAFTFKDDPAGEGCPFGAHIRRMNPRADTVVPSRHRPLVRRGIPYGPKYDTSDPASKDTARGLLGLFFCADIEAQFEHLLREWADMNPMGTPSKSQSKDPLIGNHADPQAVFDVPMPGEAQCSITGFRPFVKTLGTAYALFPSLHALKMLNDRSVFGSTEEA